METIYYPRPTSIDPIEDSIVIERADNASGTSLQGVITASFDFLCKVFGPPTETSEHSYLDGGGKVNCEWDLYIDGEIVTIYAWKQGVKYTKVTEWHVGGQNKMAEKLVREAILLYKEHVKAVKALEGVLGLSN